jgi:hypothetical protein
LVLKKFLKEKNHSENKSGKFEPTTQIQSTPPTTSMKPIHNESKSIQKPQCEKPQSPNSNPPNMKIPYL